MTNLQNIRDNINADPNHDNVASQLNSIYAIRERSFEDGQWFQDIVEAVVAAIPVSCNDLRKITKIQNLK